MKSINRNAAVAVATAVLAGLAAAAYAGAGAKASPASRESALLKDRAGAVLNVGTKTAVAYYVKKPAGCEVSVIVAETYPEQIPYALASVRFTTNVPAGTSSELATSDGGLLGLSCAKGAASLAIESRDTVAWSAAPSTN